MQNGSLSEARLDPSSLNDGRYFTFEAENHSFARMNLISLPQNRLGATAGISNENYRGIELKTKISNIPKPEDDLDEATVCQNFSECQPADRTSTATLKSGIIDQANMPDDKGSPNFLKNVIFAKPLTFKFQKFTMVSYISQPFTNMDHLGNVKLSIVKKSSSTPIFKESIGQDQNSLSKTFTSKQLQVLLIIEYCPFHFNIKAIFILT